MTIKWGRVITVECDTCEETIESVVGENWDDFWTSATRIGWRARRVRADQWTHGCPKHEA